ncbi:MAG: metallophosphoesterase [Armatimonadota bacterium]
MLLIIFILALIASLVITARFKYQVTPTRLIISLVLSGIASIIWYIRELANRSEMDLKWQVIGPTFQLVCFVFPLLFLAIFTILLLVKPKSVSKRKPNKAGTLFAFLMLFFTFGFMLIGIDSNFIEPNWIEVTHTSIKTSKWKKDAPPLKIVQLSDLHIERLGYRENRAISIVKELKPDIILLTGDYSDEGDATTLVQKFIGSLHAKYGVFAVDGNWTPLPSAEMLVEGTGARMLDNESVRIETGSGIMRLIGIRWSEGKSENPDIPMRGVGKRDEFSVLMCHLPDISFHSPRGIDLIVAGHTHGGQVRIPFLEATPEVTRLQRNRLAGLMELSNGTRMYINRGLGMEGGPAPRIRFRCRPEISVITIRGTD